MRWHSMLVVVGIVFAPASLGAQAALRGSVREDSSKYAVQGVEIVVEAAGRNRRELRHRLTLDQETLTDTSGTWTRATAC